MNFQVSRGRWSIMNFKYEEWMVRLLEYLHLIKLVIVFVACESIWIGFRWKH